MSRNWARARLGIPYAGIFLGLSAAAGLAGPGDTSHEQVRTIRVTGDGAGRGALTAFCVAPDGRVLAGCASPDEIRIYSTADGKLVARWPVAVEPEAMCLAPDGRIHVAGDGKILVLDAEGQQVAIGDAPHARILAAGGEELRKAAQEEIDSIQESFADQIEELEQTIEELAGRDDLSRSEQEQKEEAELMLESLRKFLGRYSSLDEVLKGMRARKARFSSISVTDDHVLIAAPALVGYSFDIWRSDKELGNAEKIVSGLSGCCGQMDVQVDGNEVFVAENGRHRVACYDFQGKLKYRFGKRGDRDGADGFGGCCNPVNLAFSPQGGIFTSESEGTIKLFDRTGESQGITGHSDLPPGCKNVAIRSSPDARYLYMIDIERGSIVVFERRSPVF